MRALVVPLGMEIVSRSETPNSNGSGSTAALIAVAGIAMILATAGLIFVVVRRKPAEPAKAPTRSTAPVEESDTAPAT